MDSLNFEVVCRVSVANVYNDKFAKSEEERLDPEEVKFVWMGKTLQNNKATAITGRKDELYFELTYNGDKDELYIDVYTKMINALITHVAEDSWEVLQ